ncbi:hypothetical protein BU23DRAFT_564440 [Bimuria novae-zelandiae CBS 107.79]|uniref:Uncharacterized protein n=1 Tax=Bimuria novae-zelandiae CBS 107.79 TaxID=1447943 RepID=A0A6A5VNL8_9PLEO|nr:hypothetical protein BU23DRAFT_564440 [Bimuria novae-zelandiae CBS 107.79]
MAEQLVGYESLTAFLEAYGTANAGLFLAPLNARAVVPIKNANDSAKKHKLGPQVQFGLKWDAAKRGGDAPGCKKTLSVFHKMRGADVFMKDIQNLKNLLTADVNAATAQNGAGFGGYYVDPNAQGQSVAAMVNAALNLIANIDNIQFQSTGRIEGFKSPSLEAVAMLASDKEAQMFNTKGMHLLFNTGIQTTVVPRDTLIDLDTHSARRTFTTVLSGEVIWIVWPGTPENIEVMLQHYDKDNIANFTHQQHLTRTIQQLQHGIIFGQGEGTGMRVPPFCISLGLAAETTVLATSTVTYAQDMFASLDPELPHAVLTSRFIAAQPNKDEMEKTYSDNLCGIFQRILQGENDRYTPAQYRQNNASPGVMHGLVRVWDTIKRIVFGFLYDEDSFKEMLESWKGFISTEYGVREIGSGLGNCVICDHPYATPEEHTEHFEKVHWRVLPPAKKAKAPGAQKEPSEEEARPEGLDDKVSQQKPSNEDEDMGELGGEDEGGVTLQQGSYHEEGGMEGVEGDGSEEEDLFGHDDEDSGMPLEECGCPVQQAEPGGQLPSLGAQEGLGEHGVQAVCMPVGGNAGPVQPVVPGGQFASLGAHERLGGRGGGAIHPSFGGYGGPLQYLTPADQFMVNPNVYPGGVPSHPTLPPIHPLQSGVMPQELSYSVDHSNPPYDHTLGPFA